jgi:hypothetical protein
MSIRQTVVQLYGTTLELEGEPGALEMQIAKIVADPRSQFTDKVIQAAMAHDAQLIYTGDGHYTKYLTYIMTARKWHDGAVMPEAVQAQVDAAINEIMADVTVSYYPATELVVGCSLKFYMGQQVNPHSIKNFWAAVVLSLSSPEASLAA